MNTTIIRNEDFTIIGFADEDNGVIYYRHVKKGRVGQYDTRTKIYRRILPIPGKSSVVPVGTGDFGESDLRYWG